MKHDKNLKLTTYTKKDLARERKDAEYLTKVAIKWGFKKTEAEEAGFHLGEALTDFRLLIKQVDKQKLSPNDFYKIMSHMPYHTELAYQALFHDISAGVYDFIEGGNLNEYFVKLQNDPRLSKKNLKLQYGQLKELLNKWDPINLHDKEENADEYDCFIWPILKLLQQGKGEKEIAIFLSSHLQSHVGVTVSSKDLNTFSQETIQWWRDISKPQNEIKVDVQLTPDNCQEKGYMWWKDTLYDQEAPLKVNKDLVKLVNKGYRLGKPASTDLEQNNGVGLYRPKENKT